MRGLNELCKQGILENEQIMSFCEHCVFGKQTLIKFNKVVHRTKDTLDYVHSDVWGPLG